MRAQIIHVVGLLIRLLKHYKRWLIMCPQYNSKHYIGKYYNLLSFYKIVFILNVCVVIGANNMPCTERCNINFFHHLCE